MTENKTQKTNIQIVTFWEWMRFNEKVLYEEINSNSKVKSVQKNFKRTFKYMNSNIQFFFYFEDKILKLVFTSLGKTKATKCIQELEKIAPSLLHLKIIFYVFPIEKKQLYLSKKDGSLIFNNYPIKISDLYLQVMNFDSISEKISIIVFHPYENCFKIKKIIHLVILLILGEFSFKDT